jgi:hypothetical protein
MARNELAQLLQHRLRKLNFNKAQGASMSSSVFNNPRARICK